MYRRRSGSPELDMYMQMMDELDTPLEEAVRELGFDPDEIFAGETDEPPAGIVS